MRSIYKAAILGTYLLVCAGVVHGQQPPGTRSTPCDPLTPNNALCLQWSAPATNTDGTPTILPLVYRLEQQFNTGAWTQIATGLTTTRFYAKGLAIGTYTFRVYANCTVNCVESSPTASNSKDATAPVVQPGPPVGPLVVQVTISSDRSPVFRIVGSAAPFVRGEFYGLVPVGRECGGPEVFRWRGKSFHLVHVEPSELWGTANAAKLAAPCG